MGLLGDLIKIFVAAGLSEAEAKAMADRDWGEIQDMRAKGSAADPIQAAIDAGESDYPDEGS